MLPRAILGDEVSDSPLFQWAPTLGGECYAIGRVWRRRALCGGFNGHPPLGVNATYRSQNLRQQGLSAFQWAPTLGGECYCTKSRETRGTNRTGFNGHPPLGVNATNPPGWRKATCSSASFNGHPPLGVNATSTTSGELCSCAARAGFNGHPPLGVNATIVFAHPGGFLLVFQWAPTLGGECYRNIVCNSNQRLRRSSRFNGHPPLGVNATAFTESS